jgi:hypothetical protein
METVGLFLFDQAMAVAMQVCSHLLECALYETLGVGR